MRLVTDNFDAFFFNNAQGNIVYEFKLFFVERIEWRKPVTQYFSIKLMYGDDGS